MIYSTGIRYTREDLTGEYRVTEYFDADLQQFFEVEDYLGGIAGAKKGEHPVTENMTEQVAEMIESAKAKMQDYHIACEIADTNKAVDAYNKRRWYQKKGQKVKVIDGKKNKGFEGVVFWEGNDDFKGSSKSFGAAALLILINSMNFVSNVEKKRIGIKNEAGEIAWVNASYVKVIEGFEELPHCTEEKALKRLEVKNDFLKAI